MITLTEKEYEKLVDENADLKKKLAKYKSSDRTVVEIAKTDLKNILNENEFLRNQVAELQAKSTFNLEKYRKSDILYNVAEFHHKFSYPVRTGVPTKNIPDDEARHRARLIAEECLETLQAIIPDCDTVDVVDTIRDVKLWIENGKVDINLPELVDGLIDLEYVIGGTHLAISSPRYDALQEVQRSNMAKDLSRDGLNKPVKPEGWTPPDIEGVLKRHGWEG